MPRPDNTPQPTTDGSQPGGPSPALVRALRQLLRPLVRLMLAQGITYPYLADLLKGLFVEVAEKEFRLDARPPTDSRVSLVSGVHRKDVSRLRQLLQTPEALEPSVVPRGAQLVAHWMGDARYVQEDGKPRPLARLASEGGEQSFEALVSGVNSDIRSRVVLDEWLRLGVVHLDDEGRVCLNTGAFVPTRGADEKAFYLGHNLHDHAAAAVHNVLGGQPPFMERSVHYNALAPASVDRLAKLTEQVGMKALLAVNKAAMEAEAKDSAERQPGESPQRITMGVYFYAEPAELAEPAGQGEGMSS
ncbi:DUF6502 family protein [Hydrogenophaga sp.]|uniref:DUF6502 family protein n=1 Tax=Hydrogenophaga sp. TaxID=1904254 RepID=UPI0026329CD9|nr:DUF6502 family protein [Hydrogenophaga sp.]MDM7950049.1 DUF6502 family protein [Hydrogenophaga sp.]